MGRGASKVERDKRSRFFCFFFFFFYFFFYFFFLQQEQKERKPWIGSSVRRRRPPLSEGVPSDGVRSRGAVPPTRPSCPCPAAAAAAPPTESRGGGGGSGIENRAKSAQTAAPSAGRRGGIGAALQPAGPGGAHLSSPLRSGAALLPVAIPCFKAPEPLRTGFPARGGFAPSF